MPAMSSASNWDRPPDGVPGRGETLGFAERTRKNLEYILAAHDAHEGVHVVTQVILSLLGVVVFPFERHTTEAHVDPDLQELAAAGWPLWDYVDGSRPPKTLSGLIGHLRHATAHNNVSFSSDSRFLHDVVIGFKNNPPTGSGRGRPAFGVTSYLTSAGAI